MLKSITSMTTAIILAMSMTACTTTPAPVEKAVDVLVSYQVAAAHFNTFESSFDLNSIEDQADRKLVAQAIANVRTALNLSASRADKETILAAMVRYPAVYTTAANSVVSVQALYTLNRDKFTAEEQAEYDTLSSAMTTLLDNLQETGFTAERVEAWILLVNTVTPIVNRLGNL